MAYRDQYDYGDESDYEDRRRRDYGEDEGFYDRFRGWVRGRMNGIDRKRSQDDYQENRDYGNYPSQQRGYRSRSNRDYGRDYGYSRNNPEWERTRQWRRDYSGRQENQGGYIDRYGEGQQRYGESQRRNGSGWGTDQDYEYGLGRYPDEDQDYRYDYGQSYGRGSGLGNRRGYRGDYNRDYSQDSRSDYDRGYNRGYGWDQSDDENGDYHRDFYSNQGRRYADPRGRQTGYSRDFGRDYGVYSNRNYGPGQAYPAAGMGADYGGRSGYDNRDMSNEDVNFGEGDVGYESEGAFYQDMDEPVNYETQDYQSGSGAGWFRSGMGPQGYQRSDERITEDVCERLTRHGRIDASNLEIDVKNGEVFLKGTVPDRQMKRMAEDVAEDISGVKDVHNEIKVKQRTRYSVNNWESPEASQDWGDAQSNLDREARQRSQSQGWDANAETSPAGGESNVGAGFESAGATSLEGLESVEQQTPNPRVIDEETDYAGAQTENRKGVREGMEVIGSGGQVVGRVKEIRVNDFLVDREMARDIYVPFTAIDSVGEQVLLTVGANEVDNQGWEKPALV